MMDIRDGYLQITLCNKLAIDADDVIANRQSRFGNEALWWLSARLLCFLWKNTRYGLNLLEY